MLSDYLHSESNEEEPPAKGNIVRACSEALAFAVAKCFDSDKVYEGFAEAFYPRDCDIVKNTKMLITVLNGGKNY
jgi:hypothetical protein